jgi:hypothetical protein
MKLQLELKDYDGLATEAAILDASPHCRHERARLFAVVERYMRYGEYFVIEFDTADGSAVLLPKPNKTPGNAI